MSRVGDGGLAAGAGAWQTLPVPPHASEPGALPCLDRLFPPGVACVVSHAPPPDFALLPAEQDSARPMGERRYAEFLHGRACTRLALARLGVPDAPVPIGASREPLWPAGIVGSITHAQGIAAAAVGRRGTFASLGLDVELATPLEPELVSRVCRREEILRLGDTGQPGAAAKLIFSIKESVYKCIWPLRREFIGFLDVEVRLDEGDDSFTIVSHAAALPASLAGRLRGRFHVTRSFIATAAAIAQSEV